jgi:methylamine---glutamate N-methyltransferase subunit B
VSLGSERASAGFDTTPSFIDLEHETVRSLNATMHGLSRENSQGHWRVLNPRGRHAIVAGLDAPISVDIVGNVGYYCAGMNQQAHVVVHGNAGVGVAENMMSGRVEVEQNASQAAGASAHGGILVVHGDAAARCAISLKGADIVVRGSVGHMAAFMGQSGRLVVCGDAGEAFGDSIYEIRAYVCGAVAGLGADCVEKELRPEHHAELASLLDAAGVDDVDAGDFRRYGSARTLYHFHADHSGAY